jgi:Fe-S-cluster containining protein
VSGLETALTVRERRLAGAPPDLAAVERARAAGTCPFLRDDRLCGAHDRRPLGCRVYFCDREAAEWQSALYERTHRAIVDVHERFGLPYSYGEWRDQLEAVISSFARA